MWSVRSFKRSENEHQKMSFHEITNYQRTNTLRTKKKSTKDKVAQKKKFFGWRDKTLNHMPFSYCGESR